MRIQGGEESPVAALDHRRGDGAGADDAQPRDLALRELRLHLRHDRIRAGDIAPARQDLARPLDVGGVVPAVVEHRLGEPFVGIVLEQVVEEADDRIGRQHRAADVLALEPADQRRGVDHRLDHARGIGQVERGQQLHRRRGHRVGRRAVADEKAVGQMAVAQHRQHLAGVGGARRPGQANGIGWHWSGPWGRAKRESCPYRRLRPQRAQTGPFRFGSRLRAGTPATAPDLRRYIGPGWGRWPHRAVHRRCAPRSRH